MRHTTNIIKIVLLVNSIFFMRSRRWIFLSCFSIKLSLLMALYSKLTINVSLYLLSFKMLSNRTNFASNRSKL